MIDEVQQAKKLVEFQQDLFNATKSLVIEMEALNEQYNRIVFGESLFNPVSITMVLEQNLEELEDALEGHKVLQNLVNQLSKDEGKSRMNTVFKKDKSQHEITENRIQETLQDLQANIYETIDRFAQNFKSGIIMATEQFSELVIAKNTELMRTQLNCSPMGATQSLNNMFFTGNLTADSVRKQVFKFSSQPLSNTGAEYMEDTKIDLNKID